MLKVFSVIFKTAPFSVNSSICTLVSWFEMNPYNQIDNGTLLLCQFENKFIENLLNFEQQQNIKTENQN